MYSMLIVDDEKIERRGIQSLISKFSFPFDVVESKNVKEALEYLKANSVDILLTDIKMPFMDGIELAKEARALFPNIKIIIFSAYGEFEYAKKAMGLNVIHFILKPIDIDEFCSVMSKVVQLCSEEEALKKEQQRILQGYEKGIMYEREKLLFQLLYSCEIDEEIINKAQINGLSLKNDYFQPLLIDCSQRFFDAKGTEFENHLNSLLRLDFYNLSLNERQSLIILNFRESELEISEFISNLRDWIIERGEKNCSIVIGRPVTVFELNKEYNIMEQLLEYKFFIEGPSILKVEDYSSQEFEVPKNIDDTLEKIYKFIEIRDEKNIKILTEALFENIKKNEGLSSIYVKHIFMEVIRRIFESSENNDIKKFRVYLDEIYNCNNIGQLKDIWLNIFSEIYSTNNTINNMDNRKVIDNVLDIIRAEYSKDIGVEYIADRVYLSPNYLGQLFKKHTGKNLTRYIMEYRLACAKEFLEKTNLRVADICDKTGFTNSSYFNLIFKNHYGITPAQYREKVK